MAIKYAAVRNTSNTFVFLVMLVIKQMTWKKEWSLSNLNIFALKVYLYCKVHFKMKILVKQRFIFLLNKN